MVWQVVCCGLILALVSPAHLKEVQKNYQHIITFEVDMIDGSEEFNHEVWNESMPCADPAWCSYLEPPSFWEYFFTTRDRQAILDKCPVKSGRCKPQNKKPVHDTCYPSNSTELQPMPPAWHPNYPCLDRCFCPGKCSATMPHLVAFYAAYCPKLCGWCT